MGCRTRAFVLACVALAAAGCLAPFDGGAAQRGPPPSPSPAPSAAPASGVLEVHYLSVGQGDATVWRLPSGALVVYDCGPSAPSPEENPLTRYLRDRLGARPGATIHALVASHGHFDHVGGCEELLEEYRVSHVYEAWYEGADRPDAYEGFLDLVAAEGAVVHTLRATDALPDERVERPPADLALPPEDAAAGVRARVLWPRIFAPSTWDRIGEESLVVRLEHGATAFCFQGDVELAQEEQLAALGGDLSCDAYLAGHHGSRQASGAAWLARMDPEVAVVSFGQNSYGHPTSEALCRMQEAGARVYATHRAGDLVVSSDGATVRVAPDAPETADYCAVGASYWSDAAPPAGRLAVSASPDDATPCRYSEVTVTVEARDAEGRPVAGAEVSSTWRYRSTAASEAGVTDAEGVARLTRAIGGAAAGHEVVVEVTVRAGEENGSTSTRFVPEDC